MYLGAKIEEGVAELVPRASVDFLFAPEAE
jgi:hypothetical protein